MSENKKLIFLDVDATLYSKEQRLVPESTIKAIHEAQENGHKVLINTGRPLVYFEKEILDIGCDGYLCSNGVHILLDGETIYHKTVPETEVMSLDKAVNYFAMRLHNNTWGDIEDMKVEIRNLIEPLAINGEIHNKTVDKVAWVSWSVK